MSNSALDAGIPVLTEVIQITHEDAPPETEEEDTHTTLAPQQNPGARVVDVPAIEGWLTEEWGRLERKIGGRILHQVMERLESDIEERVRDALADVLQISIETLAQDIKQNLQHTLNDIISQAVKKEISHMQNTKR